MKDESRGGKRRQGDVRRTLIRLREREKQESRKKSRKRAWRQGELKGWPGRDRLMMVLKKN